MTTIEQTTNEVSTNGLSRRHFIQAAAATGVAVPFAQMIGGSSVGAAGKVFRYAAQAQEGPAAPWMTKGGSLGILNAVGSWLCDVAPSGELKPSVARSWKGSNGGQTWTFTIRKDVKFHDG